MLNTSNIKTYRSNLPTLTLVLSTNIYYNYHSLHIAIQHNPSFKIAAACVLNSYKKTSLCERVSEASHRESKASERLSGFFIKRKIFSKFFLNGLDTISAISYSTIMTIIRKKILESMAEQNLNTNQLVKMLKGEIPRQTIYDFLSEHTDGSATVIEGIMQVLNLEITQKKVKKRQAKK